MSYHTDFVSPDILRHARKLGASWLCETASSSAAGVTDPRDLFDYLQTPEEVQRIRMQGVWAVISVLFILIGAVAVVANTHLFVILPLAVIGEAVVEPLIERYHRARSIKSLDDFDEWESLM